MRNEYRRSLIMLRSNAAGYSGHVRLERRTLMGSMYFTVQAPPLIERLRAALVGRDQKGYYACEIGELTRDNRDQLSLAYSFDPGNICNRELEAYQLITVSLVGGENLTLVLFGNVNGYTDLNRDRVQATLLNLYFPDKGSVGGILPAPPVAPPVVPTIPVAPPVPPQPQRPSAPPTSDTPPADTPMTLPDYSMEQPAYTPEAAEESATSAAEDMGADPETPWPEAVETLKPLFFSEPALKETPDERFTYVSAPMPEGSGYASCCAGIRMENGAPVEVSYAMPDAYREYPPAGMEEYHWVGDQNAGWWVYAQRI